MCARNCVDWMKLFGQYVHLCGRSPVWTLTCRFSVSFAENLPSHCKWNQFGIFISFTNKSNKQICTIEHAYGFSPVCDRRCLRSAPFEGNDLSQRSHGNGFSPVWVRMWMLQMQLRKNKKSSKWNARMNTLTWATMIHRMICRSADTDSPVFETIGQCARANVRANCRCVKTAYRIRGTVSCSLVSIHHNPCTLNADPNDICA